MSSKLVVYDRKKIASLTKTRAGETKFGEKVRWIEPEGDLLEQLAATKAAYVLFGIPEDVGVIGNHGVAGAKHAWHTGLTALLNIQSNKIVKGSKVLVLGHLDTSELMNTLEGLSGNDLIKQSRKCAESLDKEVTDLVRKIVTAGKVPIIIGGGHNNSYGNIKGCSLAKGVPVNALNIDAHTDFRQRNSRHSGNGFSWAYYEGFLNRYFMYGIHENYTSKKIFEALEDKERIRFTTFEDLFIRQLKDPDSAFKEGLDFVKSEPFGIEVDMDAIAFMPSSAQSPSGLKLDQVRQMVYQASRKKNTAYLHLCEAAPDPGNAAELKLTGKAIAYLISDFIRK
ncbi:arginase [Robertkochia marina]|uniref:Arginase n=1 Tax=Robertkochia marina TaxID=1227945 RepID=A0A4V3UY54_9FLAO|nr:formimidoylglutamase [Robertkochia marina]THD67786.1 arginase [Robertkochia marina]TRZ41739.1 arginase [Robertkochia marina]